jgi:hypothetical protein
MMRPAKKADKLTDLPNIGGPDFVAGPLNCLSLLELR